MGQALFGPDPMREAQAGNKYGASQRDYTDLASPRAQLGGVRRETTFNRMSGRSTGRVVRH